MPKRCLLAHCESLSVEDGLVFPWRSPHHSSIRKGEDPWYSAPITLRYYQNTVVCPWFCFWPVQQCGTCMRFQAQNAATSLTPTPTPSHPGRYVHQDYLIFADFYSKVILVCNLPTGQSNSAKVIHILEEWFCNHVAPEVLCTDNGPQYASAAFADCSIEWGFTHETSCQHCHSPMDLLSHVSKKSGIHYSVPNTVVQIQGLHYSTSRPPWLLPNFPHLSDAVTTTRYIPQYHLGSAILTQQPCRFKSTLRIKLSMSSSRLISTPSNLHHSMLVSPLQHLTP